MIIIRYFIFFLFVTIFLLVDGSSIFCLESAEKYLNEAVNVENTKGIDYSFITADLDDMAVLYDSNNIAHLSYNSKKIKWTCRLNTMFAIVHHDIKGYWITPQKDIWHVSSDLIWSENTGLTLNNKKNVILADLKGAWTLIVYIENAKAIECPFILDDPELMKEMSEKWRPVSEVIAEKQSGKTKGGVADDRITIDPFVKIWNGDTEKKIQNKIGKPHKIVSIDDNRVAWFYWTYSSSGGDTVSTFHILRGDPIGALFTGLLAQGMTNSIGMGDALVVVFRNGKVYDIEQKGCRDRSQFDRLVYDGLKNKIVVGK